MKLSSSRTRQRAKSADATDTPAYFDADNEPLIDEYVALFGVMQAALLGGLTKKS